MGEGRRRVSVCRGKKPVGEPDAGNSHVGKGQRVAATEQPELLGHGDRKGRPHARLHLNHRATARLYFPRAD